MNDLRESQRDLVSLADDIDGLPSPVYRLEELYEDVGSYRNIRMAPDTFQEVDEIIHKISWTVSLNTLNQYIPYIRNFFALAASSGRDPYALRTLRDWIYTFAYPRMKYLAGVEAGATKEKPRQEPGLGKGTLTVAISAIAQAWAVSGRQAPNDHASWRKWLRGLYRRLRQPKDRKAALLRDDILHMIHGCQDHPNTLVGMRNQALILLGWSAALRKSEIGAVQVQHFVENNGRWFCNIPHSKTDQNAVGYLIPLYAARNALLDPILAWHRWIDAAQLTTGPAFRAIDAKGRVVGKRGLSHQAISNIIQAYTLKPNVSAHSLRIGYCSQAKMDGFENWRVMLVSRHKSEKMVDEYTRPDFVHAEGPGSLL